jgi:hypothetical protein
MDEPLQEALASMFSRINAAEYLNARRGIAWIDQGDLVEDDTNEHRWRARGGSGSYPLVWLKCQGERRKN